MPTVSALLSGSVSVGILAGVVSGLFYLVVTGFRWAGKLRSSLQSEGEDEGCPRCETSASGRKCSVCARRREVKLQSGDWFYRNIQSRFSRTAPLTENNRALENGTAMDPDSAQIREFIERLVEALVSGQLDDVKVNRVYTHPEYKPLPEDETPSAVHAALKQRVQRIIDEAMTLPNLKSQVPVQNGNSPQKWDDDITSMTYEDILATAILNKVIEQFQHRTGVVLRDTVDGNSNLLTPALNSMDRAPKYISRVEIGVNGQDDEDSSSKEGLKNWSETNHTEPLSMTIEECIEEEVTMYDSAGEEEGGGSSDGMATTGSELDFYLSGLSFIKNRRVPFPELGVDIVDGSKEGNSDEEDERSDSSQSPQPTDLISPVDSWEENWLFQRRHLKAGGSTQRSPMPVPMLVPNPSEDFRARIGDRDAEEVSDLSDCSDGALEDIVLSGVDTDAAEFQLPKISVNCESHGATAQPIKEGRVTGQSAAEQSVSTELTEATNVELVKASSVECLSEFGQQDSEYTEDYASVTQRQLSSLTEQIVWAEPVVPTPVPKPRTLPVASLPTKSRDWCPQEDSKLATPPQPGTIAEREHRKWESALPLPNNPYSPENINKRLSKQSTRYSSRSSSATSLDFPELKAESPVPSPLQVVCTSGEPDYKRYGRDYYINQSKSSSGERCSSSRVNSPLLQQVRDTSHLLDLEQQALHRNIYRNSFRACNSASLNFTVNPLFEPVQSEREHTDKFDHAVGGAETMAGAEGVFTRDGVTINPLFDPRDSGMKPLEQVIETEMADQTRGRLGRRDEDQATRPTKLGQESGYSSSLDSLADPQTLLLRLLPPSEPQMVERSFQSLSSLRRSESLKDNRRKPRVWPEMGGSFRVRHIRKRRDGLRPALY